MEPEHGKKSDESDISKYFKDIQTIKELLIHQERRPVIAPWVFMSWSIIILVTTILQFILVKTIDPGYRTIILEVWIPASIVGCIFETVAWLLNSKKEALALNSRLNIVYAHTLVILSGALILLILSLLRLEAWEYLPVIILVTGSILMILLSLLARFNAYVIGELYILAALIIYLRHLSGPFVDLAVGLLIAVSFFVCGLIYRARTVSES